jgi:hypothetical protein
VSVEAQAPGYMALSVSSQVNPGGAHPISGETCALLDTRTGEEASLLAVLGPRARSDLTRQVTGDLHDYWKDNNVDPTYLGDAGSIAIEEAFVCYVDREHLEIRFSPTVVAPYMDGTVTFPIDVGPLLPLMPRSPARDALFAAGD